ncbi:MAG: endonuclease/exonuclease/phosphatase family protein [Rhizobiales bacterium]|nr:endonuclease/exonuclease/phosphatase family protein [Hyphomicrobiales bacterium]
MPATSRTIRLLTYNVHACRGTDGRLNPARVARVIADCRADIVALQELDVGRRRSGGIDQAQAIATHLEHTLHFHPALHLEEEKYGDAILTALPSRLVRAGPLPSLGEPRGALCVAIDLGGVELLVLNTHLGLRRIERLRQAAELLGPDWLGHPRFADGRCVLLGDLNSVPSSPVYRLLAASLRDAALTLGARRARPTFPSRLPLLRLDHVLLGKEVEARGARVVAHALARRASDHLPLLAEVAVVAEAS